MALSMTLQYMDKQALPAASILGIIQDLVSSSAPVLPHRISMLTLSSESVGGPVFMDQLDLLVRVLGFHIRNALSDGSPAHRQSPRLHLVSQPFPLLIHTETLTGSASAGQSSSGAMRQLKTLEVLWPFGLCWEWPRLQQSPDLAS